MELNAEEKVKALCDEIKKAKSAMQSIKGDFVSKKATLLEIEKIGKNWFSDVRLLVLQYGIDDLDKNFDPQFQKLLKLSSGTNRVNSFKEPLNYLAQHLKKDVLIKVQTTKLVEESGNGDFDKIIGKVIDQFENEYLKEAVGCVKAGFNKASVVLGWCACVDRIHRKIEELGFTQFNGACASMYAQKTGRFKRFEKKYTINSIGELREVFDNDILWVIEGMGLVDSNAHTRLKSCFDMRNHSGHPGEAPVTTYNILSFFSDIVEIVLANKKFELKTRLPSAPM